MFDNTLYTVDQEPALQKWKSGNVFYNQRVVLHTFKNATHNIQDTERVTPSGKSSGWRKAKKKKSHVKHRYNSEITKLF